MDFSSQGKHSRKSTGTTDLPTAKKLAEALAMELITGRPQSNKSLSIAEAIESCLTVKKADLAGTSLRSYATEFEFFKAFAEERSMRTIDQIRPSTLDDYAAWRAQSKSPTGAPRTNPSATGHKARQYLKMLTNFLYCRNEIPEDPFVRSKVKGYRKAKPLPPRMVDAMRLVKAADPAYTNVLAVLAMTGMRIGELGRLSPHDIDFESGFITIRSTPDAKTKTGLSRRVPIAPTLQPYLQAALSAAGSAKLLFTRNPEAKPVDRRPLNHNSVLSYVKKLARSQKLYAGRSERGWTPHIFRHCLSSHAIISSVPQGIVDEWLGHVGEKSVSAGYNHHTEAESLAQMRKLKFSELSAEPSDDNSPDRQAGSPVDTHTPTSPQSKVEAPSRASSTP